MLDSVSGAREEHGSTPHSIPLCHFPGCPFEDHLQTQELHKQPVTTTALLPQPLSWQHRGAVKRNEYTFSTFHLKMDEKLEESLYIQFFT